MDPMHWLGSLDPNAPLRSLPTGRFFCYDLAACHCQLVSRRR